MSQTTRWIDVFTGFQIQIELVGLYRFANN